MIGETTNETVGWSVAPAGDVTCDGVDDVLVGAPQTDTRGVSAAYLLAGDESLSGTVSADEVRAEFVGLDPDGSLGFAAAGLGLADGGGPSDVAIGAPFYDVEETDDGQHTRSPRRVRPPRRTKGGWIDTSNRAQSPLLNGG